MREDPAERLRRQASYAACRYRPVMWLAVLLYAMDAAAPRGASPNTGKVGALMVASGDFGSGERSRPGRLRSADMLGLSERTVERHWKIIGQLEMAVVTVEGCRLSAERFGALTETAGELARWRDRKEFHLVLTAALLRQLLAAGVDLAPYKARARALLAEIAGPAAVDNLAGRSAGGTGRVAPSRRGFSSGSKACDDQSFLSKQKTSNGTRPDGRTEQGGAASRPSPTKAGRAGPSGRSGRRMPREAVQLARDVLAGGHFPWLYRTRRPVIVAALRPFAAAGWTARDVEVAANNHLQERRFSVPTAGPDRPVSYLLWLLSSSDIERPPAQTRDAATVAAAASRRARQQTERNEDQVAGRVTATELAERSPLFRERREAVRRNAEERSAARRAAERAQDVAARQAAVETARARCR